MGRYIWENPVQINFKILYIYMYIHIYSKMVIIFDYQLENNYTGSGFFDTISTLLPLIKSGAEAAVPIAQTAKLIKETTDVGKTKNLSSYELTKSILNKQNKDDILNKQNKDDIFARINENIAKKKSGAGFIKVDYI